MSDKRWFVGALALAALICAAVAAFNFAVDPWGLNFWLQRDGFNRGKPALVQFTRLGKAHAVTRTRPSGAVLGASTAEQGIAMEHAGWRDLARTHNLSFSGATMEEIELFVREAHAVSPLRRVVIGLDFFSFNAHLPVQPQLYEALAAMHDPFAANRPYFSWKMLWLSIYTVLQQAGLDPYYLASGQSDPAYFQKWLTSSGGHRRVFLFSERGLVKGLFPQPALRYELQSGAGPSSVEHLRRLAEFAQREGIELRLFFSPTHARLLEVIRLAQLWPTFERWKQQVVRELEPVAQRAHGKISIWDFADYSSITAETVPAPRDAQSRMRWFWDSQHYKPELGNLVQDRLFGSEVRDGALPDGYGVLVNAVNIDAHLLDIRARREAYAAAHADDMPELRANIEKALPAQNSAIKEKRP